MITVRNTQGNQYTRNVSFIKRYYAETKQTHTRTPAGNSEPITQPVDLPDQPKPLKTYPRRQRQEPNRY